MAIAVPILSGWRKVRTSQNKAPDNIRVLTWQQVNNGKCRRKYTAPT